MWSRVGIEGMSATGYLSFGQTRMQKMPRKQEIELSSSGQHPSLRRISFVDHIGQRALRRGITFLCYIKIRWHKEISHLHFCSSHARQPNLKTLKSFSLGHWLRLTAFSIYISLPTSRQSHSQSRNLTSLMPRRQVDL